MVLRKVIVYATEVGCQSSILLHNYESQQNNRKTS